MYDKAKIIRLESLTVRMNFLIINASLVPQNARSIQSTDHFVGAICQSGLYRFLHWACMGCMFYIILVISKTRLLLSPSKDLTRRPVILTEDHCQVNNKKGACIRVIGQFQMEARSRNRIKALQSWQKKRHCQMRLMFSRNVTVLRSIIIYSQG